MTADMFQSKLCRPNVVGGVEVSAKLQEQAVFFMDSAVLVGPESERSCWCSAAKWAFAAGVKYAIEGADGAIVVVECILLNVYRKTTAVLDCMSS